VANEGAAGVEFIDENGGAQGYGCESGNIRKTRVRCLAKASPLPFEGLLRMLEWS